MEDAIVIFKIKINEGIHKGGVFTIESSVSELEDVSLVDLIIDNGYLKSWSNNNEYETLGRKIKLLKS